MTKAELMKYIGKKVHIYFKDGERSIYGTLGYVDEFSAKHDYRKPDYFYIGNTSFKVSHVRKLIDSEGGLKACPFCGNRARIIKFIDGFKVGCDDFGCRGGHGGSRYFSTHFAAQEAWNRRADHGKDTQDK